MKQQLKIAIPTTNNNDLHLICISLYEKLFCILKKLNNKIDNNNR